MSPFLIWNYIKNNKEIIIFISLFILVIGFYLYLQHLYNNIDRLSQENKILKQNNQTLQDSINIQKKTIEKLQQDFKAVSDLKNKMDEYNKVLDKKKKELDKKIHRDYYGKDSLETVILKDKKNRVEKVINEASRNALRCLEILTGSKQKPNENIQCIK